VTSTDPLSEPPPGAGRPAPGAARPAFAHASEAEFARILDFYDVRWEYEPSAFPIRWSLDGRVLESFAPDFYLPDLAMYVELTTLRQRLVRKKNRKLRRLRELYPDVRIKLFYERDFRALMLKYGKVALADALSGSLGQVAAGSASEVPDAAAAQDASVEEPTPIPDGSTLPAAPARDRPRREATIG
jgi:hypoxanthine phosphoribosyltransferase